MKKQKDFQSISSLTKKQLHGLTPLSDNKLQQNNSENFVNTIGKSLVIEQSDQIGINHSVIGSTMQSTGKMSQSFKIKSLMITGQKERDMVLLEANKLAKKGKLVSVPHWINDWRPTDSIYITSSQIDTLLYEVKILNEPCQIEQGVTVMEQTLELYGMPNNWNRIVEFYLEAIEDLPLDAIIDMMRTCRMNLKWFPKPSELRSYINKDYWKRCTAEIKLNAMKAKSLVAMT